ncbi:MAG TPA: hypothetical protein VI322_00975 [Candidatus Saccharimonadia bacterium]
MSERDQKIQEGRLRAVLNDHHIDAATKAKQIMKLGFDPEIADEIVARHQLGNRTAVAYYESLNFADVDDLPEPNRHT